MKKKASYEYQKFSLDEIIRQFADGLEPNEGVTKIKLLDYFIDLSKNKVICEFLVTRQPNKAITTDQLTDDNP